MLAIRHLARTEGTYNNARIYFRRGCVRGQVHAFLSNKKIGLIDPGSKSF